MSTFRSPSRSSFPSFARAVAASVVTFASASAAAQEAAPADPPAPAPAPAPPPAKLDELDQRITALEKKSETAVPANPNAGASGKKPGIVALATDDVSIRLRPILQADGRFFVSGGVNQFVARRVRPAVEATFFERFELRITPELGNGTASVVDAWGNLKIVPELQLRFGKMKAPFGLERLQNDSDLHFVERALPSSLAPDRDVGVQLHGDILKGTLTYAIGLFDGAPDAAQIDGDPGDRKDVEGRIFARPFATAGVPLLEWLGFGIAATTGQHDGAYPSYKTAGQNAFFSLATDGQAAGTERRIAPQAYWYLGPVGVLFEWTHVKSSVARPTSTGALKLVDLEATAYSGTLSLFITGESASYTTVAPLRTFDPARGHFGAIELDARIGTLHVDEAVFAAGIADPSKAASRATEIGVGVQWHLAPAIKLVGDWFRTTFSGGAAGGADRDAESVFIGRFQVAY